VFGEQDAVSGRHELDVHPFRLQPDVFHDSFTQKRHVECMVIAMGHIIALIQPAAADKHAVFPVKEGLEYKFRVDSAGTHDANQPDLRCILQSGNSSQVSSPVCSPVTYKAQYPGFEFDSCAHALSPFRYPSQLCPFKRNCLYVSNRHIVLRHLLF